MKSYYIFIFFILFWLLIVIFCRNNSFEKFKTCHGCVDSDGICYNAHPRCSFKGYCLSFDDENGKLHAPCGSDQMNIPISDCIACKECRYCINKQNQGKCIPANEFNCKKCPGTYLCYRNIL